MSTTEFHTPDLQEAFDLLDFNKTGVVDIKEALHSLKMLEYDEKYPEIYNFVESFGEGKFNFDQFAKKAQILLTDVHEDVGVRTMYDLFINNPDKEVITRADLEKICKDLGERFTDKDLDFIMQNVGDGRTINFGSFKTFMNKKINE
jgi:Ca2+-binding EF-hand superfamily protein